MVRVCTSLGQDRFREYSKLRSSSSSDLPVAANYFVHEARVFAVTCIVLFNLYQEETHRRIWRAVRWGPMTRIYSTIEITRVGHNCSKSTSRPMEPSAAPQYLEQLKRSRSLGIRRTFYWLRHRSQCPQSVSQRVNNQQRVDGLMRR